MMTDMQIIVECYCAAWYLANQQYQSEHSALYLRYIESLFQNIYHVYKINLHDIKIKDHLQLTGAEIETVVRREQNRKTLPHLKRVRKSIPDMLSSSPISNRLVKKLVEFSHTNIPTHGWKNEWDEEDMDEMNDRDKRKNWQQTLW